MPKGTELTNEAIEEIGDKEYVFHTYRLYYFQCLIYVILLAAVVLGSFPNWWGGLMVLAIAFGLTYLTDLFLTPSIASYLVAMQIRLKHSIKIFKKINSQELVEKYEGYLKIIDDLIPIYGQSKLRPPNGTIRGENPYGNATYLLDNYFVK